MIGGRDRRQNARFWTTGSEERKQKASILQVNNAHLGVHACAFIKVVHENEPRIRFHVNITFGQGKDGNRAMGGAKMSGSI